MTDTPFAGVPTLRDAEPALPPPAQVTATSALADPPLGRGAFYSTRKLCPHCRRVFFRPMKLPIHNWNAQRVCKEDACRLAERRRKDRERESTAPARTTCEFCKAALPKGKKRCCGDLACKRAMHQMEGSKNIPAPSREDRVAKAFEGFSFRDDRRQAAKQETRFTKLPELRHTPSGNGTAMCASARRT